MIRKQNIRTIKPKPKKPTKIKDLDINDDLNELVEQTPENSPETPPEKSPEEKEADAKKYIHEQTKNYLLIKSDQYNKIRSGDHIKYVGADGKFKRGGFIWYKKFKDDRPFWMVGAWRTPNFAVGVFRYVLYWDKIQILWKRTEIETGLLIQSIDRKQDYIADISIFLSQQYGQEFIDFMNKREVLRRKKEAEKKEAEES
jgi:hypothetical protein